jgi:hypothetical protein
MEIKIKEVKNKKDLKKFIYLPAQIHKNHKNWVPPVYMDEFNFYNPKKNISFNHSQTILFLAYKENKVVGRVMGIIPTQYNEIHNEQDVRFGFIETYNDKEVFHALIKAVEDWGKKNKCKNIVGPLGFSDKDPQGFLIEGFDAPPIISANINFPYMPKLIEEENYTKKTDLVVYNVPVPNEIPEFYKAIYQRVLRNNPKLNIIDFKTKKHLKPYIIPVLKLLNETFKDIYAFSPYEENEMKDFAKRYLPILDPEFIKVIENEKHELLAFFIAIPEISEGIIKAKGKVLPFGIFKIMAAQKKTKQLTLLLGGIKEQYRGKGLDVLLGYHMLESALKRNFDFIDSHLELETNTLVRREMESMGGKVYKKYRIYTKKLV